MITESNIKSAEFGIMNNVYIEVVDTDTNNVRQNIEVHNKATRGMVKGILRFLSGHFTDSNYNDEPRYDFDSAKQYIPCCVSFGDANIKYENGKPIPLENVTQQLVSGVAPIPTLVDPTWTQYVNYRADKMEREIVGDGFQIRKKITEVSSTYLSEPTGDMDSLYFYCTVSPQSINFKRTDSGVVHDTSVSNFLTEVGLFAGYDASKNDMLAYIRHSNWEEPDGQGGTVVKTNTLFVRPQDTIVIRWIITIAAIGKDSVLYIGNIKDEHGDEIPNNVKIIPDNVIPIGIRDWSEDHPN